MTQKNIDSLEILLIGDCIPYIYPNMPVQENAFSLSTILI